MIRRAALPLLCLYFLTTTSFIALATGETTSAPAVDAATGPVIPPPATIVDTIEEARRIAADWETIGWIAGVIAIINMLINAMSLPLMNSVFDEYKIGWTKPYISAGLGGLLGGFSSYQTGVSVGVSIVAGILAGLAAIGAHETAKRRKAKHRVK